MSYGNNLSNSMQRQLNMEMDFNRRVQQMEMAAQRQSTSPAFTR